MSHVFISYSKKDHDYAHRLAAHLLSKGFDVWIDDQIDPGIDWWPAIVRAIRASGAFITIMTEDADASPWVQRENLLADKYKIPAFPFWLSGDYQSSEHLSMYVNTQHIDVRAGNLPSEGFYKNLAQLIPRKPHEGKNVVNKGAIQNVAIDEDLKLEIDNPPEMNTPIPPGKKPKPAPSVSKAEKAADQPAINTSASPAKKKTGTSAAVHKTRQHPAINTSVKTGWMPLLLERLRSRIGLVAIAIIIVAAVVLFVSNQPATVPIVTPQPTPQTTFIPSATPCSPQIWWDSISQSTAQVINNILMLSVSVPPVQMRSDQSSLNQWKTTLQSSSAASPCAQTAQQALLSAADQMAALYNLYLTTSTQVDRAQQLLNTMDAYLAVADDLNKLSVKVDEDWLIKVQDFSKGECPARRWYIRQFIIRDYQRYFTLLQTIDIRTMSASDLQNVLSDLRTLSSSFKTDSPDFPACVQSIDTHYSASIDAAMQAVNAALNGNMAAVNDLLVTAVSEKTMFQTQLKTLDPTIYDSITQNL